jgi:hypothetical protein
MCARDPGVFWYKVSITLRSHLTPQQVSNQLSNAPPLFDLDTGCPVTHVEAFIRRRIFSMKVLGKGAFRVKGPLYRREASLSSTGSLVVNGCVEPDEQGSLIHLAAVNGGVVYLLITGSVLVALSVCAVAMDFFLVPALAGVGFVFMGIIGYLVGSRRSRTALEPLVLRLENMLKAQRTP